MASENELRALLAEARECVRDFGETLTCDAESHRFHTSPCQACYVGAVADRIDAALAEPVLAAETNYYAEFNAMRDKAAKYGLEATQMRKERDEARAEVERLKAELDEKSGYLADVEKLIPYKDYLADKTCAENMEVVLRGAYQRGAEAMREAIIREVDCNDADCDCRGDRHAETIRALPIPEDKP